MSEQKVLIVDRDSCVISTLCEYLSDELYDVFTARDGVAGFKTLRREKLSQLRGLAFGLCAISCSPFCAL